MQKIRVQICMGTTCFIMGASHLEQLSDALDASIAEQIEIKGCHCLSCCGDTSKGKPPFVMVQDEYVSEATIERVLAAIKRHLPTEGVV